MSNPKRLGWAATPTRPIYIRFKEVRRSGGDYGGITLFDAEAGFSKEEEVPVTDKGTVTLYDNFFGWVNDEKTGYKNPPRPLTNPCMVYQNDKGYWEAHPFPFEEHEVVLTNPFDADPAKEKTFGGKGGGKWKDQTIANLDKAIAYTDNWFTDAAEADREYALALAPKVLGCASMIHEWGEAPPEAKTEPEAPPTPDDGDVPF